MKLSREEEMFLRHWMYDEVHYEDGAGPAKRLQLQHQLVSADLAVLIAAAIPNAAEQQQAGIGPPPIEAPIWPWSNATWRERISDAKAFLESSHESRQVAPGALHV